MKSKENNLEKNISRLVKLAGDSNEPGKAFADSVVKNALDELKGTKAEREGNDKFVKVKWKRTLSWAAVVLVVCGIGFGILISNAGKTGETTGVDFSGGPNELVVKDSGVELVVEETSLPTKFDADEAYENLKVSKNLDAFLKQNEPNYNMLSSVRAARAAKPVDMVKPKPADSTPVAINIAMSHGPVKDGLAAFLLCHRDRFKIGEPIPLNYGIINVGPGADVEHSHNVRVWFFATRPWDPKNFVWLEVTGPDGKNIRYHGGAIEWRAKHPVDKNSVFLRHRQFIGTFFPDLRETFELNKPGTYKVRLGYNPWFEGGPWTGELMSNEIQIEIVK